jgi:hypothetical protein
VHLVCPICGVLAAWGTAWAITPHLPAFATAGCVAVVVYQLVLAAELALAMTTAEGPGGRS